MLSHRPRHFAFLAIAAALFVTAPAQAQSDPGSENDDPAVADPAYPSDPQAAEAAPAEDTSLRLERMKVQAFGVGYHAVLFRTEAGDRYALHGPAVNYDYFVGRRWGFAIHGEAYFPFFGRYSGQAPDFRDGLRGKYDARRYGLDISLMAAYRAELSEDLLLFIAGGVHFQSFTVTSEDFLPVQAITMGLGFTGRLQWNFHPRLFLGVNYMMAFDPLDLIKHRNRATITIPLTGALALGVRY
jgi:hypothetical protein